MEKKSYTLRHTQTGELNFKIAFSDDALAFRKLTSYDYYTAIWVREGGGSYRSYLSGQRFGPSTMLFFTPDQPFMIIPDSGSVFITLQWHSDFFCLEKNHKEVSCNGVLFNNVYVSPCISIPFPDESNFHQLIMNMQTEVMNPALAQWESLVAYLKIFLINASRLKIEQSPMIALTARTQPEILSLKLKDMIEQWYREKHLPRDYAEMLSITYKALGRLTRNHFNKTPTELIHERIIMEAKQEFYLTEKTVKEVAYFLGFKDEYYFSRLFKKTMGISPQVYKSRVGEFKTQQSMLNMTVPYTLTRVINYN